MPVIKKKVKLQLAGLDGNAFALMGAFQRAARQQGRTKEEIDAVLTEARSGDYNHLLATLMDHTESPEEEDEEAADDDEENDLELEEEDEEAETEEDEE